MNKFTTITDKVIPLDLDNVDTDMIIPAIHLKSVSKDGYKEGLFSNLKNMYPDFIFNNSTYNQNSILISKSNFGCGSSREHAVWALQQYGIKVVICSSFSDIFYNNATKNGLLLITLKDEVINKILTTSLANSNANLMVDLEQQKVTFQDVEYPFEYDQFRKHCLIEGVDDLDYLLSHNEAIAGYEKNHIA